MATAANGIPKRKRVRYSAEYRAQALAPAERFGVAAAASELRLHAMRIYQSRVKAAHGKSVSDRERQLAEKSEDVAILRKTAAYFAKNSD